MSLIIDGPLFRIRVQLKGTVIVTINGGSIIECERVLFSFFLRSSPPYSLSIESMTNRINK